MTEAEIGEASGLVARFYHRDKSGNRHSYDHLFDIQRRLMVLGVKLNNPLEAPDPHAPPGGSTQAVRAA